MIGGAALSANRKGFDRRPFRRLWASTAAGNLGDGVLIVSLVIGALDAGGALGASLMVGSLRVPGVVLAPAIGAFVDRYDEVLLIRGAALARTAVCGVLAALAAVGEIELFGLLGGAMLLASIELVVDIASQVHVPEVVDESELISANGRIQSTQLVLNEFVGPVLGGALIGLSFATSLGVVAVLFGSSGLLALALARSGSPEPTEAPSIMRAVNEGLGFLRRQPTLRALLRTAAVFNLAAGALLSLVPGYLTDEKGLASAAGLYGVTLAVVAACGTFASLIIARLSRRLGPRNSLVVAAGVAVSGMLVALVPETWVFMAALGAIGWGAVAWNVVNVSIRQAIVERSMLGKVSASFRAVGLALYPVGAVIGGGLATRFGYAVPFVGCLVCFSGALVSTVATPIPEEAEAKLRAT
ncbi:MAG: MFS transporter [Acidimicrobiales bacterium]